jgi:hypothetical protein
MESRSDESSACLGCLLPVVVLMLVVGAADMLSGPEISPWIGYLFPVALASRCCGFGLGALYAVLAGFLMCVAARHAGHPFSTNVYFYLAAASQTFALVVVAWLVSRLASAHLAANGRLLDRS